jgi:hypothetical protein
MPTAIRLKDRRWSDAAWLPRAILSVALLTCAALLLRDGAAMLRYAAIAIGYPLDLDYGEGIVWQQARDIVAGYGYRPIGVYPAIVFHYPPVYHVATIAFARLFGVDELAAGRSLSVLATFVTMGLVAWSTAALLHAGERRRVRMLAAAAAPFLFISMPPVMMWFAFMRVDMLAGALSLGGLLMSVRAVQRPWEIAPAAILFVLAIYTKQTSIAAPGAAFLMLCCVRPRLAAMLLAACLALGLVALAGLSWSTGGGFLRHILGYNLNRYDPANWAIVTGLVRSHLVLFLAAISGAGLTIRRLREAGAGTPILRWRAAAAPTAARLALILFLLLKTAMLPLILKSGSSYNYLIEWLSAVAILAAVGLAQLFADAFDEPRSRSMLPAAAALVLAVQLVRLPGWDLTEEAARRRVVELSPLIAQIRAAKRPVISDDMILLIRAGKPVRWEPAIAAELGQSGVYDERAFARLIRAHAFAFFVTKAERGDPLFDDRYNPVVADALEAAYPRKRKVGGLIVRLPPS